MPAKQEQELVSKLEELYAQYQDLNRKIGLATHRPPLRADAGEIGEEQPLLREISRVMDRMRAVEGNLRRVRGQLDPL